MLNSLTAATRRFLIIAAVAFATIAGAWIFEYFGYAPCELCLKQRWAYYAGVPLALICRLHSTEQIPVATRYGLMLIALLWIASAFFGVYHSGVEWKWWPGPTTCTGGGGLVGPTRSVEAGGDVRSAGDPHFRPVAGGLECGDLGCPRVTRAKGAASLRDRVPYPSRDSPASSGAGSWAGSAGHCCGAAPRVGRCGLWAGNIRTLWGRWPPFSRLQGEQAVTTFSQVVWPPLERGIT